LLLRQGRVKHILLLWRQVSLDVSLEAPEKERLEDRVQRLNDLLSALGIDRLLNSRKIEPNGVSDNVVKDGNRNKPTNSGRSLDS
jgi:hypothetical protein